MGRRYEDRVTAGPVRESGPGVRAAAARTARPVPRQTQFADQGRAPVLPPVHGTRAAGPDEAGHEPLSIAHVHAHSDGHGGSHSHLHSHAADNRHSGPGHPHTPGNPDSSMPSAQLNSGGPGGELRDVSGFSVAEQIGRFLEGQGVDVGRALADAGYEREHQAERARAQADRALELARALRRAKRRTVLAQDGWRAGWSGSSWHEVCEMREAEADAEAELRECCLNDPELVSEAKRRAAR